ncbi:MAG: hypothetical protein ACJ76X_16905 [Solirubrobacteraceae bacterium]
MLVASVTLTLALGSSDALAGGPCPECSATYAGDWNATVYLKNLAPATGFTTEKISLSWEAKLSSEPDGNVWRLTRAKGSFSVSGSPPGGGFPGPDCSTQLSPGPGKVVHGEAYWAATSGGIGSTQRDFDQYWTVDAQPPAQWGTTLPAGQSPLSGTGPSGTPCASQTNFGENSGPWAQDLGGAGCRWDKNAGQDWVAFPAGELFTVQEACSSSGNNASQGLSWRASLSTTLTFRSPGHGPGGGPIHAGGQPGGKALTLPELKDLARKDFRAGLKDAAGPCLHLAEGIGVEATGAVWLGTSATVPGGIPSGGALIATGEVMAAAAAPLCVPKIGRLLDDYKVFADPPDPNYWQLAVPARARTAADVSAGCGRVSGKAHSFCLELASLVSKLIRAAGKTTAVDGALVTTVNRASGAKRAHNQQALKLQLEHAGKLEKEFKADLANEAAIGRQIRKLLPFGHLKPSQAAKTISYLERKGVTAAHVRRIDPAGLKPAAEDPIARLVSP